MMRIHDHTYILFMTRLLSLKALTDQNKLANLRWNMHNFQVVNV